MAIAEEHGNRGKNENLGCVWQSCVNIATSKEDWIHEKKKFPGHKKSEKKVGRVEVHESPSKICRLQKEWESQEYMRIAEVHESLFKYVRILEVHANCRKNIHGNLTGALQSWQNIGVSHTYIGIARRVRIYGDNRNL